MIIGIDLRCLNQNLNNGVSVYAYNFVNAILRLDRSNQYKIFLNRQKSLFKFLTKQWSKFNVKIFHFNIPSKLLNSSLKLLNWPKIDRLLDKVDIYWLPNINFLALTKDCQLITTIHDLSFIMMPEFFSLKGRWWHRLIKLKKILNNSKKIIAVSENTKNDIIKHLKINSELIEIIQPLTNFKNYKINDNLLENFKNKYNLSNNLILTVATFEPRKNIETIILTFEKLLLENQKFLMADWQLAIVGKVGWLNQLIFKSLKQIKNTKQIKIFNNFSAKNINILMLIAKIFIWPSYYEGFGFPPHQALQNNLKVITSFHSSLIETLNKNVIFINPFNIKEITQALITLINHNNLSKTEKILNQQNLWEDSAKKLIKLFKTINIK